MDNVTHSLTGLALSRAGLQRFCPRAVWLLVLAANAPDGDIIFAGQGGFSYLQHHRGYTHSLLGAPLMAALTVLVIAGVFRERLPWLRAWLLCLLGLASHLLLDWTNSYGIRLLLPFSSQWFHLDLNGLYDDWILLVLALAAVVPLFVRLINREIGEGSASTGQGIAIFALVFFLLFDAGRMILHNVLVTELNSRLYDETVPLQVAALPDSANPLRWTAVVETPNRFLSWTTNPLRQLPLENPPSFYKPTETPALASAKAADPFRFFLYFARFPVWSQETVRGERTESTRLDLTDLRFGAPGRGSFHCVASLNSNHQITGKWFTYGSGQNLGWLSESSPHANQSQR